MYELAGLGEEEYRRVAEIIYEDADESQEETADYDLEGMEQEDELMYEEQALVEETDQDLEVEVKSQIKIEKMKKQTVDDDEPLGYFEEVIGDESEDQSSYMETEYVKEDYEM